MGVASVLAASSELSAATTNALATRLQITPLAPPPKPKGGAAGGRGGAGLSLEGVLAAHGLGDKREAFEC